MSFAATCALVAGFEALSKQNWWRKPRNHWAGRIVKGAAALMISSALAGAATAPFSAYHFNAIAQYGLIANLAAVPMMGFVVMPCGVLAGLLALIGLEGPFLWLVYPRNPRHMVVAGGGGRVVAGALRVLCAVRGLCTDWFGAVVLAIRATP